MILERVKVAEPRRDACLIKRIIARTKVKTKKEKLDFYSQKLLPNSLQMFEEPTL